MPEFLYGFCTNYCLVAAVASWIIAQILKAFTGVFQKRDFSWRAFFFGTGGMPSSHTATVCGLCVACLLKHGIGSTELAISGVLAMVTIIDAMGVRLETGKQAHYLNMLMEERNDTSEQAFTKFKELIGHSPLQVFFGALTGVATALLLYLIPVFQTAA